MFNLIYVGSMARMSIGASALGAFKASLKHLGIIENALMAPPQIPLNADEIAAIIPFLKNAGLKVK
jgi:4-hydroxy-tetrahydrodipicolinate synthase